MRTFRPAAPAAGADLAGAAQAALNLVETGGRVTFLVNDPQRHTDTPAMLSLLRQGLTGRPLRILVATGSHTIPAGDRLKLDASLQNALGSDKIEIAYHDCRAGNLVKIGSWTAHPWLTEDGSLISIGSVEPHYFAGFTGSHKTCTIGCCGFEAIQANHSSAVSAECRPCRLQGNPVAEGIRSMLFDLEAHRPVVSVNLVQSGRDILFAAGGRTQVTLAQAAAVAVQTFAIKVDAPADVLIAEVTGALGQSFYQAEKGIKNNEWVVRDGGAIVLVADCPAGIGQNHFVDLLRSAPTHAEAVAIVESRGYRLGDHKAVRLRYLTDPACRNVRVFAVSAGLSLADAAMLGVTKANSVDDALAQIARADQSAVYRVIDAGNTCLLM
ncbi:MAG: DUF2088 domain-containing protein [Planctomycetes bacterium]|nr:DUF2088 domain-containing protein [Planctomycetota bacterium]